MTAASMNMFDLGVLTIIGLSALLSFFRGFVREILSLGGWVAASAVTMRFLEPATHFVKPQIKSDGLASGIAAIGLFFITLILFSILSNLLLKVLKIGDKVGLLDNLGGLTFGIARGVLIVSLGYFLMTTFFSEEKKYPEVVRDAASRPYVAKSASWIASIAPEYLDDLMHKEKNKDDEDLSKDAKKRMNEFIHKMDKGTESTKRMLEKKMDETEEEMPASSLPSIEDLQQRIREENERN